jgi:hypothetical protein
MLTGIDVARDNEVRASHFFTGGTPNLSLAIAIINLSKTAMVSSKRLPLTSLRLDKISLISVIWYPKRYASRVQIIKYWALV